MRLLSLVLVGCTVGPTYHRPAAPIPVARAYKEAGVGWKVARPSDGQLRGAWWQIFREPELDTLATRLAAGNQTIETFRQNYLAARAQIRGAQAKYFPTITASPSATVSRNSGSTAITSTSSTQAVTTGTSGRRTSYIAPVDAAWEPDLFGRTRNTVRQARYAAQVAAANLESQKLLAHATLAATYFQIRGQDALQEVLDSTVVANREIVAITRSRHDLGLETEVVVLQAEQTLQAARVQATNAGILRAQYEHSIATLLGVPATDFKMPRRALLAAPPPIPLGTPSHLLERRPDIAAAERQMAQANATIGIGYAAYFPTLTLSGTAGFASSALRQLFMWPSRIWSIGGTLAQTLFDAGLRRSVIDQSIAAYRASVASYRQTVLAAFQDVESSLAEVRILATEIQQQEQLVATAQQAFELEKVRYETGLDPYLSLMTQQTTLLAAKQTLVLLRVQHMTAAVSLIEALGGGW